MNTISVQDSIKPKLENYLRRLNHAGSKDEITFKYKSQLPEDVSVLPDEVLQDLYDLLRHGCTAPPDPEIWELPDFSTVPELEKRPDYVDFAIMREEIPFQAEAETNRELGVDDQGHKISTVIHKAGFIFQICWSHRSDLAIWRANFLSRDGKTIIDKIIPRGHRLNGATGSPLSRAAIAPWTPSSSDGTALQVPIPMDEQQKRIDNWLRKWPVELRSLLLCGKYNTSKTTFVCAWLTDVITHRIARTERWYDNSTPLIYKINLNQWFDEYLSYRTRDFDGPPIDPPEVTAKVIEEHSQWNWYPPILWIEELDKVTFTDTNRKWLFTLVDAVYREGGCIVATTNDSYKTLAEKLGEGIMGRIDGSRDGGDLFKVINFNPPKKT